jgi:deoxyadenosine/deoxycytidine kinase
MPKIVSVEGNIGVGKTTMLDNIENYIRKTELRILLLSRADRKWTKPDKDGVSILEKFYKDKEKYTFSFQVYVLLTIIDAVKDIVKTNPACKIIICERSLSASRYVFADMLHAETCSTPPNTIFIVDCTKKYPPTTKPFICRVRWTWLETAEKTAVGRRTHYHGLSGEMRQVLR